MDDDEAAGDADGLDADALVGRADELAVLRTALTDAEQGRPRIVLIDAEPGMGKSALINSFARTHLVATRTIRAGCDRHEQELPYGAISLLLDDLPEPTSTPTTVGVQVLRLLGDLQTATGAVVIIVDDVHWMDEPSVAALRFALRRLRADRVLAILARRPTTGADVWSSVIADPATTTIKLAPLTPRQLCVLARRQRGWELSERAARRIVDHTGGLPLLLRAFLAGAPDEVATDDDRQLPVPTTSAAAVASVLRTLDPDARALVEALAVLDGPTALVQLAQVADVQELMPAVTGALETQLVATEEDADHVSYLIFAHDLLRVAVYEALDPAVRHTLHRRAAAITVGERSLAHRVAAADRPDAALVEALRSAAADHGKAGRDGLAATRLLQARSVATDPETRDELQLWALVHRVRAGDVRAARALYGAAEASPPGALRSYAIGLCRRESGQVSDAAHFLEEAYSQVDASSDRALAEQISVDLTLLYTLLGRGADAVATARRTLSSADPWIARTSQWHLAVGLWTQGDPAAGLRALDNVPAAADAGALDIDALLARSSIQVMLGDVAAAHENLDAAIRLDGTGRSTLPLYRKLAQRSVVLFSRGRWDDAALDAANACVLADATEAHFDLAHAHGVSVQVLAGRGQWEAAAEHLELARSVSDEVRSATRDSVGSTAILLAAAREDFEEVLREAGPLLEPLMSGELNSRRHPRWLYVGAIHALVRLGRIDEAERVLARYDAGLAAVSPTGAGLTRLGWVRGLVAEARGDAAAARAAYASDLEDPTITDVPFAHAVLLQSAARLDRALGHRREAVDRLRTAHEIFVRLRAAPFVERCSADLAAAGLVVAKARTPFALTPREQDIATLVARGMTNSEVAAEVYVTAKTVEYHLGNIYSKLGITSRRQLRTLLAA